MPITGLPLGLPPGVDPDGGVVQVVNATSNNGVQANFVIPSGEKWLVIAARAQILFNLGTAVRPEMVAFQFAPSSGVLGGWPLPSFQSGGTLTEITWTLGTDSVTGDPGISNSGQGVSGPLPWLVAPDVEAWQMEAGAGSGAGGFQNDPTLVVYAFDWTGDGGGGQPETIGPFMWTPGPEFG